MTIEEIANSMTRDEFHSSVKDGVLIWKHDSFECPSELNLHDSCGATRESCEECWMRAVENVKFKGEGENKDKESVTELKKIIKFQSEYITKLERMLFNE